MKALKEALTHLSRHGNAHRDVETCAQEPVGCTCGLANLLGLVLALPDDGVVVPREQLDRWASAAMDATSGTAIKGDGYMFDDERRALYAIDTEIQALLKESA